MASTHPNFAMAGYLNFHKAIRRHFDNFLVRVGRACWKDRNEVILIQKRFDFYWAMVEHHHLSEDRGMFPMLAGLDPDFAAVNEALGADHHEIDEVVARMQENLKIVLENQNLGLPEICWQQFCNGAKKFHELMAGHLDREEEAVSLTITRNFTVEQQNVMEAGIIMRLGLDFLSNSVPWMHEVMNEEERLAAYEHLPQEIRPYYHLWRKEYQPQTVPVAEVKTAA